MSVCTGRQHILHHPTASSVHHRPQRARTSSLLYRGKPCSNEGVYYLFENSFSPYLSSSKLMINLYNDCACIFEMWVYSNIASIFCKGALYKYKIIVNIIYSKYFTLFIF